jgi:hypothetical protein
MLRIKAEPELQHVLAHFRLAIDYLAEGNPKAAQMEMQSIEATIEYDTIEEQESFHATDTSTVPETDEAKEQETGVQQAQGPKEEEVDGSRPPG